MKTLTFSQISGFIASVFSASILVVPFALSLIHLFIPVLILYPWLICTIISWVVTFAAQDIEIAKGL